MSAAKSRLFLPLMLCIFLSAPMPAYADALKFMQFMQSVREVFSRKYIFLGTMNGCYDGTKKVSFSFDTFWGENKLRIPINYITNFYNWDGIVHLWVELGLDPETFAAYCDRALPMYKAGIPAHDPSFPKPVTVLISSRTLGTITMDEKIAGIMTGIAGRSVVYTGDENGYSVFKHASAKSIYREYLIPNTNEIGALHYLECNAPDPQGTCKMFFHYKQGLRVTLTFRRSHMENLGKMHQATAELLDKFYTGY